MIQINCNVNGTPTDVPYIRSDGGPLYPGAFDGPNRCIFILPTTTPPAGWGGHLNWQNTEVNFLVPVKPGAYEGGNLGLPTIDYVPPVPPTQPSPPIPTREAVCGIQMSFLGGLVVPSSVYGNMPWWPSALSWCDAATRQNVYAAMREAGDTHAIIHVPSGDPLYNEGGQFYSPEKFGALDWTAGQTTLDSRFSDLVDEVIAAGFRYLITMDEQVTASLKIIGLVMQALSAKQLAYGLTLPGYDGVFYGWEPEQIMAWGAKARALQPTCYLGLEHQPGRIPLGEGGDDYKPGGRMQDFDVVLGEFDGNLHQDSTWQILGRMVRPYHRPVDQQGDENPPFYLVDSSRGPRYYCAFETDDPYYWVRTDPNNSVAVQQARQRIGNSRGYLRNLGARYTG